MPYARDLQKVVIHCFSQSQNFADRTITQNWYIGIGAPITYPKNDVLRSIIASIPLSNLVLETDAPFLPPQALRGKQNHPAYIADFAPSIAQLYNITTEDLAHQTTTNAYKLFELPNMK